MRAFENCFDRWRSIDLAAYVGEEPEIPLLAEIYAPQLEALKIRTHDASNMVTALCGTTGAARFFLFWQVFMRTAALSSTLNRFASK
jgi:hypothetical protein